MSPISANEAEFTKILAKGAEWVQFLAKWTWWASFQQTKLNEHTILQEGWMIPKNF